MGSTLCYWSMVPRRSGLEAVSRNGESLCKHNCNSVLLNVCHCFWQISWRSHIQRYFHLRRTANMLCFKWEAFSHMMDRTDVRREFPLWLKRAMGSFDGWNSWANRVTVCTQRLVLCYIWSALKRWVLFIYFSLVQQVGQWRDAFWFHLFRNALKMQFIYTFIWIHLSYYEYVFTILHWNIFW